MIVLDTHIWLWWVNNDTDNLDSTRKEQIESSDIVAVSMETPKLSSSTSPRCSGVSWRSVWGRRLSWLISALSGTLEIEAETERLRHENAQMRKETEQMRKETEQVRKETEQVRKETEQVRSENARLAELESKIDGLFSKYNIKLPQGKRPEQP